MIIKRKLGPKGQVVLPKDIRTMLGLKPGSEIIIEIEGSEVKIKPSQPADKYLEHFFYTSKKLKKKINIEKIIEGQYSE
jgi:AbrB family looped-hinge helix DNA binding protein